jgi:hypothetical protein
VAQTVGTINTEYVQNLDGCNGWISCNRINLGQCKILFRTRRVHRMRARLSFASLNFVWQLRQLFGYQWIMFELTSSKLTEITYCKNAITAIMVCLQKGTKTHTPLLKVQIHKYHLNLHLRLSIRNLSSTFKNYGLMKGCRIFRKSKILIEITWARRMTCRKFRTEHHKHYVTPHNIYSSCQLGPKEYWAPSLNVRRNSLKHTGKYLYHLDQQKKNCRQILFICLLWLLG